MPNIRLDFISNIEDVYVQRMKELRAMYIDLDLALSEIEEDQMFDKNPGAMRTISLARTHLETSLMYAIKSLCIIGEIKDR